MAKKFNCPLCGTNLPQQKYLRIVGAWEAKQKTEVALKKELKEARRAREDAKKEMRTERAKLKRENRLLVRQGIEKGQKKEKARADRLAKSVHRYTDDIKGLNKRIKELQTQLKSGTTPQVEGLNLEAALVRELRKAFPGDKIEHHGKGGDIFHKIMVRNQQVGSILYECKRTPRFDIKSIHQTKRAMALRQATFGMLVTTATKKGTAGFFILKDVAVVHPFGAVYLAKILRQSQIDLYDMNLDKAESAKRSEALMRFIRGDDFKSLVRDSIYRTKELYDVLKKEMKSHKKVWEDRYGHYRAIHLNSSRLELATDNIVRGQRPTYSQALLKQKELPPPKGL